MDYFPVFLDAQKLNALVIGGGNVAARKVELLLKTPAKITIISPLLKDSVKQLVDTHQLTWINARYTKSHLSEVNLVIAATNIKTINQEIANDAKLAGLLLNVVDDPQLCNYITPAIIDRSPMIIALSSSGTAPILLQLLKSKIDNLLPSSYGKLAEFCGKYRKQIQQQIDSFSERRVFWKRILEGDVARHILNDDINKAEQIFQHAIQQQAVTVEGQLTQITIFNQDPNNLSMAAYQTLQQADCVVLSNEVDAIFFDYARRDASKHQRIDHDLLQQKLEQRKHVAVISLINSTNESFILKTANITHMICGKTENIPARL